MHTSTTESFPGLEAAEKLGLSPEEYGKIKEYLGREPNYTELSIFSVMWSEHCSYKNSIKWLKTLPKEGKRILAKAGEENAGLVDIGDGLACAFKIESHNHPSAIEPYQGAATGVGGIHRDIFTMGARPIASLNSLRFGDIELAKTKWLLRGIVKGIGDYGNAFGIPTVGGEVYFDESYNHNPLVNAMSIGIVENGKTISATSYGEGNPVYIVGSSTGKDGIHGATFASEDISENSADKLPSVQVGDPFQEKLLLEASLEAIETGHVIGMQDMGAAGIICSTSEMSAKGEHGMKIKLDAVPLRNTQMEPFEILLSESQERMLIVIEKGKEADVEAVFEKWDLNCVLIGEVIKEQKLYFYLDEKVIAEVEPETLVLGGKAPVYERESKEPKYLDEIKQYNIDKVEIPHDLKVIAQLLTVNPIIASKKWITEQYDSMVQTNNTSTNEPSDAAIIRIKPPRRKPGDNGTYAGKKQIALAVTTDCNANYVYADPEKGTAIAVAEAARNIVCSGGEPLAITNCLNFGNPYNKEVYWQFVGAIKGMSKACRKFGTPVTGGNVSFYNQSSDNGPVMPSPVIGMIGILDDVRLKMTLDFKSVGNLIYLLGESKNDISCSQYLMRYHKIKYSPAPHFDLDAEHTLHKTLLGLIRKEESRLIRSAHDLSEGGLFIALLESAMHRHLGFKISSNNKIRKDAYLFGEAQGRVIISIDVSDQEIFESEIKNSGVVSELIGEVTAGSLMIDEEDYGDIAEWIEPYENALESLLKE
ncbi:MAG: phosphoribosylformylglycinamidine synthase subunit PurL [Bacteroidetes bacterium]|nr:phosphoribosylformylglycinamidine synthase subunit PurL [Bacteroidota bacterium]